MCFTRSAGCVWPARRATRGETGAHPRLNTEANIKNFRRQLKALGFSYDWSREVNTTDPDYFKWTQWIFRQLFQHGLAYVDERPVWWCSELKTVLANEEVVDGRSEWDTIPSNVVISVNGFCGSRPMPTACSRD